MSEKKRTQLFKKVLDPNAYERVIIGTTMWNQLSKDIVGQGYSDKREAMADVWGDDGAQGNLMVYSTPVTLQMKQEMATNGGNVSMSPAGRHLDEEPSEVVKILKKKIEDL
ncbi:hypothetical protein BGZ60DRAFT_529497 [Tricladium varicosporioides]|nr:hypothetical protein BGZ60DRAFT_529497 [Hymenoscyphus varicosporioides]